jgi:flavin reductase (DIM6/NTAB) family NADH-FMN oxidoreductase RutF
MLAEGEPPLLVGLLDSLSSLHEALCETRRCAVQVLVSGDERTASLFDGSYPGDPFDELDWADGTHGPRLARRRNGADCELIEASDAGYRSLVRLQIAAVSLAGSDESPLALYRGQFRSLAR